jgi:hypothetical protein
MKSFLTMVIVLSLLTGCRSEPPVQHGDNSKGIRATAIADAQADIAAGKPRVAYTGGFACWAVGVPPEDIELVKNLPRVPLPCGCTAPLLEPARIYAEAYNHEILLYLTHKTEFLK